MKKSIFTFILLAISLMFLTCVSADSYTYSGDKLLIGSVNQEASNWYENRDGKYGEVEIKFSDDVNLKDVNPESSYKQSSSSVINNINISQIGEPEYDGASYTVTLKGRIPENLPAVNTVGVISEFKVAELIFSDNTKIDLYMQRDNKLIFDDIDLKFGDNSENIRDGETIDDLKAGDGATFEIDAENIYSSSQNVEIDDVTIRLEDANNDLDISEEEFGTIREDDSDEESVSFDIDNDIDEGDYDLYLILTGKDEYGARHGERYLVTIDIEREKDDLSIKRIDLDPDSFSNCNDKYVTLTMSIENIGSNDQNEAEIKVESQGLGYSNTIDEIEIDEQDSKTKKFSIYVPRETSSGSYSIIASVYNDDHDLTAEEIMTFYVSDCVSEQASFEEEDEEEADNEVDVYVDQNNQQMTGAQLVTTDSSEKTQQKNDSDFRIPISILVILILILLLAIVVLFIVLLKS